jgi:predicted HicB family RNase H-like nuclease
MDAPGPVITTTVRMPENLHRKASQAARRDGRSLNSWIRQAITDRLNRLQQEAPQ